MPPEPPVGLPVVAPVVGDVLFWHTDTSTLWTKLKHFVDWRIQADQPHWCNHVALKAPGDYCIEAVASGVRKARLGESVGPDDAVYVGRPAWPEATSAERACEQAMGFVGRPYGFLDLMYIRIWTLTGLYPAGRTDALICSELVGLALAAGGVVIVPENGVCWTPKDLAEDPRLPIIGRLR